MSTRLISFGAGVWQSTDTVTIRGIDYGLRFNRGTGSGPTLTLTAAEGVYSGTEYACFLDCCGCGYASFVAPAELCDGDRTGCGVCENLGRVTVRYARCAYTGPGWYCVRDCGTTGAGVPVELLDEDAGDTSIEIVSGPYTSELAAAVVCGLAGGPDCEHATDYPLGSAGAIPAGTSPASRWFRVRLVAGVTYTLTTLQSGVSSASVGTATRTATGATTFAVSETGYVCVQLTVSDTASSVAFTIS
jgi:hypothetical protein